ncbi:hypothetical protein GTO89_08940 [Heliobacterium gestii]|uniref:Uncharacterized protein n=1 Tax=Heliomicrobium gestii TaxID=2699 RepID=A0A845LC68_HELGE|nr:hypothetical protein [Heliomicrobium gestii]MBM7866559.1 NTP pyrophosphatase (non-canonical NTP hydrolase) [Heliomicrobium gestii]MZP43161.1 hypothetical protein [Heliomicrobium gestii]
MTDLVEQLETVFPRLALSPTIESTMIKLVEEAGELAEICGKVRRLNGEERQTVMGKLRAREVARKVEALLQSPQRVGGDGTAAEVAALLATAQKQIAEDQLTAKEIDTLIARELLDVMQTCATFMYQLDVDLDSLIAEHREKLIQRGYISSGS